MLDHVSITVSDLGRARRFYDAVMATLEAPRVSAGPQSIGYGRRNDARDWAGSYVSIILGGSIAADRRHWCFKAPSRAAVDRFHAEALAAGGRDDGCPGVRAAYHPHYYAAFVLDPDGNRIEAVCHRPPA